jgi:hypothetical protein
MSVKWASFVERTCDFLLFIINESALFLYSIQKSRFQIQLSAWHKFPISSSVENIWSCLVASDTVLLIVQFDDRLEYCWVKQSQLPVFGEFCVVTCFDVYSRLLYFLYSPVQKKLIIFNNFTITLSDRIVDFEHPITLSDKNVMFTTEIGNISNLFDESQDLIVEVYQTALDSTIIISKCKI